MILELSFCCVSHFGKMRYNRHERAIMEILGKRKLEQFALKHADIRTALCTWIADVERERWQTPHDIKAVYQSADFLPNNRVIFNLRGNHYRLVVVVVFVAGRVVVEWIGTHAEYDKRTF